MLMERILCCIFGQNGLRFGNVKFENCVFICHSAHLAVSLQKISRNEVMPGCCVR